MEDKKEKLIFQEKAFDAASSLLKENSIEQPLDDIYAKMKEKKPLHASNVLIAARKITDNVAESEVKMFLQKELNISPQIADKIYQGIKSRIIPFSRKVPASYVEPEEGVAEVKPITARPVNLINELGDNKKTVNQQTNEPTPKKTLRKKTLPKEEAPAPVVEPPIIKPVINKKDSYRESIE